MHAAAAPPLSLCRARARPTCRRRRAAPVRAARSPAEPPGGPDREVGPALKALWYAAEAFGAAVGALKPRNDADAAAAALLDAEVLTPAERLASIRADYDVDYFISGKGEMRAYADDCTFADPFVAFKGTARFKANVSNLGGLMRDTRLEILEWDDSRSDSLTTKWRFSATLALPWTPRLAAAGGTTHVFDERTGRVVRHEERWDIEPAVVVKQLFSRGKAPSR